MRGSPFPAVDDSFAVTTEATAPFCANFARELADAVQAIERLLGADPSDLTDLGGTDHADVATILAALCRIEVRTYTHLNSDGATKAITFANAARFTSAPRVFLFDNRAAEGNGDDTFAVANAATSGFDSVRNISNGIPATGDRSMTYLAILWPD